MLHTNCKSSRPCAFREDYVLPIISLWQIITPLGLVSLDPRGMFGRIYKGVYWTMFYTKYQRTNGLTNAHLVWTASLVGELMTAAQACDLYGPQEVGFLIELSNIATHTFPKLFNHETKVKDTSSRLLLKSLELSRSVTVQGYMLTAITAIEKYTLVLAWMQL